VTGPIRIGTQARRPQERDEPFRALADDVPAMIWIARADRSCEFVNRGWLEFTGRTLEQECGRGWADDIHPADRMRCESAFSGAFAARRPFTVEYRLRHRSGAYRWIRDQGAPRHDEDGKFAGYIGSATDITEQRSQLAELRRSEERYREVVNTQTDLVCRYHPDTTLTFVNDAYCRYFGKSRDELLGMSLLDLLPADARESALRHIELVASEAVPRAMEHQVKRPDGSLGWQHWTDYPVLGPEGQIEEYQAIGQDITDRKQAEEANRNLTHVSRLAALGTLTAMIAHDVTQPLCAILCNAEAALSMLDSLAPQLDEIREAVLDVYRDGRRADEVIKHIRSLSRKGDRTLKPQDLNATIEDVLRFAAADMLARHVEVRAKLEPGLPAVAGDAVQLQQVLLNLMLNAMDAMRDTPNGSRYVAIETKSNRDGGVEVTVADRGHGVDPADLPRLFDAFFTTKSDGMSIGMGLAIARSIVTAHGGRIWAENNADGGATLHFTLSAADADAAASAGPPAVGQGASSA
jgi:PAS domain S-box-containing protein